MEPALSPVASGEVVAGKYRVEHVLGSGGMGVVVAATHLQLDQKVALKFVRPSSIGDRVLSERFLREARASFRLRSENTVRVLDVGEANGVPFMVMELLVGKDLRDVLTERGRLTEREAADYTLQALAAVQEAHAHGVVHRDLKPRNLFVTRRVDGTTCVKVLDFGISKVQGEEGEEGPLTNPEIALGSPRYMAPEQWKSSAAVDGRADLFALGVILYEMLTGELPLKDLPLGELLRRVVAGAIPSPRDLRPELSEAIAKVTLKALRPRAEERFQTAALFAIELRAAVGALPAQSSNRAPPSTAATAVVPRALIAAQAAALEAVGSSPPSTAPETRPEVPDAMPPPSYGDNVVTTVSRTSAPQIAPPTPAMPMAPPAKPLMSTLQSTTLPPDVAAALARAEPKGKVEEVHFDDATTVDPPAWLKQNQTLSMTNQVSPAAQSVPMGPSSTPASAAAPTPALPAPPPTFGASYPAAPAPMAAPMASAPQTSAPQFVPVQTVVSARPTAPAARPAKGGAPMWIWVVLVLVVGFAVGGGLAYAFAMR